MLIESSLAESETLPEPKTLVKSLKGRCIVAG